MQSKLRLDPSIFREHGAGIQPRSQTQHVEIRYLLFLYYWPVALSGHHWETDDFVTFLRAQSLPHVTIHPVFHFFPAAV